jgi:RNA polymerase sigma-70 factor (ECF subfamily)
MNKVKDKNIAYYQSVYLQYAPLLTRFAEKFVSGFFAEDIVHDVFLRFWDKQVFSLPTDELKRILYAAVRNACIDQLRKLSQEQDYIDQRSLQLKLDELDFFEASDELFMRKDLFEALMKKAEELPERSREIFRLTYLEGLKTTEIAERLNLSVRTVENQLYRSIVYLRKQCAHLFSFLLCLI